MNSVIVVAVLGVIWAAVLIPPWLQGRRDARPNATIRSFHRQLHVLGRAGPGTTTGPRPSRYGSVRFVSDDDRPSRQPVDRVPSDRADPDADHTARFSDVDPFLGEPAAGYEVYGSHDPQSPFGPGGPFDDPGGPFDPPGPRLVDERDDSYDPDDPYHSDDPYPDGYGDTYGDTYDDADAVLDAEGEVVVYGDDDEPAYRPVVTHAARAAAARRRAAGYRRRRQVIAILLVAAAITLAGALVLRTTAAWVLQAVADILLMTYVLLLVRRRRHTRERAVKVRYLAPVEDPSPAVVVLPRDAAR